MRRIHGRLTKPFFCLALALAIVRAAHGELAWETDVERALSTARSERRAVLLDFWADWCKPCKAMDEKFWSRPEIAQRSRRLVPVRVDFDRNKTLVRKHGVSAIPAVVVLDPWGHSLAAVVGFGDTSQLELILDLVPTDFAPVEPWLGALEKNAKDFQALRALGEFYHRHRLITVSSHYLERALKTPAAKQDPRARGELLVTVGWNHLHAKDAKRARAEFTEALAVPDLERADVALFGLMAAHLALGRRADAEKAFAELSRRFPDGRVTAEARSRLQAAGGSR